MDCITCGMEYKDDVPHPPGVCLTHAGEELEKAKKALEGALETISRLRAEVDRLKQAQ